MKVKYSIYVIMYIFLFVYSPPFLPIHFLHLLAIYSLLALTLSLKTKDTKLLKQTHIHKFIVFLFITVLYLFGVVLSYQNNIAVIYPYIYMGIEIPICVSYLCVYFVKNKYTVYDILNILLIAGMIQGIIALLAFLIPSFKEVIVNVLSERSTSAVVDKDIIFGMAERRLNGFSSGLTFTTPVVQSLLSLIALYLAFNRDYKYVLFVPILLLSALINARSSFVILGYGIILIIFMSEKNTKTMIKFLTTIIASVIIIPLVMQFLSSSSEIVFEWILDGFNEIISFFQGENIGYFDFVLTYFIVFPEGLSVIFGTGATIFGLETGFGSDIGYINDMWLGGLIFMSIVYCAFLSYYIEAYKKSDKLIKFVSLLFIVTFLIMNIKGILVSNNEFINISILLSAVFILNKNRQSYYDCVNNFNRESTQIEPITTPRRTIHDEYIS